MTAADAAADDAAVANISPSPAPTTFTTFDLSSFIEFTFTFKSKCSSFSNKLLLFIVLIVELRFCF